MSEIERTTPPFFTDIMDGADHLLIESKQVECRYVSDQELAANCGPFLSDWNKQIYFIFFLFFFLKNNFSVAGSLTRLLAESKVFLAWEPVINEMQKARRTVQDFCVFNFFKCFDMSRFFFGFFYIRTEPNPRHPHAICSSSTSSSASQLTSRRRPEAKKSWILMIISPSRLPFRDV